MSRKLLEYMKDSPFFSSKHIKNKYSRLSSKEIKKELNRYREFCLKEMESETSDDRARLSVLVEGYGASQPETSLLSQCALYVDEAIIGDPLFNLTHQKSEADQVMSSYLGFETGEVSRETLLRSVQQLNGLKKAIEANFIRIYPLGYLHQPPKEIPITFSENLFSDVLPKDILDLFTSSAKIYPLTKVDRGWGLVESAPLHPCRAIGIDFRDDQSGTAIYFLFETTILDMDETTGRVAFAQTLPDEPPDATTFRNWIIQSVNQAARRMFNRVYSEVSLANHLRSLYLTRSSFVADLLKKQVPLVSDLRADTLNLVLNLDLPVLEGISLDKILEVRQKEGEAFQNFRLDLARKLRELRTEEDPEKVRIEIQNISHELTEVQINEINKTIAKVKRDMIPDAFIFVFGLAAVLQSEGIGIPALICALDKGYKTYREYITGVKENPAFFLWKIKDEKAKQRIKGASS